MSNEYDNTAIARTPAAGTIQRQGFAEQSIEVAAETATSAMAAQVKAMVEARFIIALRRPRNWFQVRSKLLEECERPGFAGLADEPKKADKFGRAWFRKPMGEGGIEGFTIRFAEAAIRCMGNIDVQSTVLYDDGGIPGEVPGKRIVRVDVLDLENNISYPTSIAFEKTVERRKLKDDQLAFATRRNSYGDIVYIVEATDDELLAKQGALVSKAIRTAAMRILPGDIQGECRKRILEIRSGDAAKDPKGFAKGVTDGFAKLNILPAMLEELLGHPIEISTPAELTDLRDVFREIRDGHTTWAQVIDDVRSDRAERGEEQRPADGPKPGLAGVTDRLREQAKTRTDSTPKPPPPVERDPDTGDVLPPEPAKVEDTKPAAETTTTTRPRRSSKLGEGD